MKRIGIVMVAILCSGMLAACAPHYKEKASAVNQPVNCTTAEADLRVLEGEKVHVGEQIAAGVGTIMPIGLVAGFVTKTAGTKWEITTGEYNKKIIAKIAEIKRECGVD